MGLQAVIRNSLTIPIGTLALLNLRYSEAIQSAVWL